jgi:hypothetical protein
MKQMQAVNLSICAIVFLTVFLGHANAHDEFKVDTSSDSKVEASCDFPECSHEPAGCADCSLMFKKCGLLEQLGITVGGHLQQGATTNSRNPTNPPAGLGNQPGTINNYRSDEYMLNQLQLTIQRQVDPDACGWDIGGQIDILYGTDYYYLQSRGLETRSDSTNHWNSDEGSGIGGIGLMGLALPQFFLDVAYDDLTVRLGHFYTALGYETPAPTEDFFYSSTFGYTYSFETSQILGLSVQWQPFVPWSFNCGIHRGQINWVDNNNNLNLFGSILWESHNESSSVEFAFDIGKEDDAGMNWRYLHSIVVEIEFADKWSYVIHSDLGYEEGLASGGGPGRWYNVVQIISRELNDCWAAGVRFEWLDDIDGAIVTQAPGPGVWCDAALGLNYLPNTNITVRPEIRWDWFDADTGVGPGHFGNGTERSQFMAAMDVIFSF